MAGVKMTTRKEQMQKEKDDTINYLRSLFIPILQKGEKPVLYTKCVYVSSSGMMRHIDVYFMKENKPIYLNWYIEKLGTYKRGRFDAKNSDSLRVGGCGIDMGFHVVYGLSHQVFKGLDFAQFKIKGRNGEQYETSDEGYLLTQRWF